MNYLCSTQKRRILQKIYLCPQQSWLSWRLRQCPNFFPPPPSHLFLSPLADTQSPLVISHTSWRLYTRSSAEKQPNFLPLKTLVPSFSCCLHNPSHSSRLPSVNSLLPPHIPAPNKFSASLSFHKEMLILPPLSEVDPRPRSLQRGAGWSPGPQRGREGPPVTVPRVFEHKAPSHCAATRHRSPNASCL